MKSSTFAHCCYLRLSGLVVNARTRTGRALHAAAVHLLSFEGHPERANNTWGGKLSANPDRGSDPLSPQLAASVFNCAREGIIVADCTGRVIRVNEAFTRITGYEQDEVVAQNPASEAVLLRKVAAFFTSMGNALAEQGHWSGELWSSRKDGSELALKLSISGAYSSDGVVTHYVALLIDITQLKKYQQLLERQADYDALTQLPNRNLFARRMHHAMDSARTHGRNLAVAFIDLDGFKLINDRHGHGFGDRVLQILAQRIKATIRDHDTLARLGGDEFVAGLFDLQQPHDCEPMLRGMVQAASAPILIDGIIVQLSASIGVAFFPLHGQEMETLIAKADQAMYVSKRAGGNRLTFCDMSESC